VHHLSDSASLYVRLRPLPILSSAEQGLGAMVQATLVDLWVQRDGLTLRSLTERVRQKLSQPAGCSAGLLKLPDVLLVEDEDVKSLKSGTELFLLTRPPGISQ